MTTTSQIKTLWILGMYRIGNVNASNATGRGNRAARRAGWHVKPTAGPEMTAETLELIASI